MLERSAVPLHESLSVLAPRSTNLPACCCQWQCCTAQAQRRGGQRQEGMGQMERPPVLGRAIEQGCQPAASRQMVK